MSGTSGEISYLAEQLFRAAPGRGEARRAVAVDRKHLRQVHPLRALDPHVSLVSRPDLCRAHMSTTPGGGRESGIAFGARPNSRGEKTGATGRGAY